ncbi:MAG TPA: radical SAM protein [Armatimonadetes bacterium]|nr:radical SAM protein [Armatimonadota bacterium]
MSPHSIQGMQLASPFLHRCTCCKFLLQLRYEAHFAMLLRGKGTKHVPERTQAQPILKSILVKPAGPDCNMNCTYCFYLHKANLFPETRIHRMSVEVLEQFILQYMPIAGAQPSFCWQGGEPTLMGLEFFERVVHFQMKYGLDGQAVGNSIQTNGLLIDDDWARFMHEYRFLVGVSLDGPQEIHDYYRRDRGGHATFERVMKAIDVLRGHDVEFNILCVINDVNVRHPDALFQFFIEHDLRFVQFIPCVERDTQTGNIADFSVSPEAYAEFLCRAFDL